MAESPIAAYWNFFTSFNTRDPMQFSRALHYPHVRFSPARPAAIVPTVDDHAAGMSWDRFIQTGWDHTNGAEPTVIHESSDRAHIKGGWTRVTKDDEPILTNHVTYIATLGAEGWGIQSRYGVDGDLEDAGHADAVAVVEDYIDTFNDRDWNGCIALMQLPTFKVDVAQVRSWDTADDLRDAFEQGPWHFVTEKSASVVMGGEKAVTVAVDTVLDGGDEGEKALFFLTRPDGLWRIQARSIMST